jgi:hypothetical protein
MRLPLVIESRREREKKQRATTARLRHLERELDERDELLREIGRNETAMRVLDTAQLSGYGSIGAQMRTLVHIETPPFFDPKGKAPPLAAEWSQEKEGSGAA